MGSIATGWGFSLKTCFLTNGDILNYFAITSLVKFGAIKLL